jgi:hypothetical protein
MMAYAGAPPRIKEREREIAHLDIRDQRGAQARLGQESVRRAQAEAVVIPLSQIRRCVEQPEAMLMLSIRETQGGLDVLAPMSIELIGGYTQPGSGSFDDQNTAPDGVTLKVSNHHCAVVAMPPAGEPSRFSAKP